MNQSGQPSSSPYKIFISYRREDSQASVDHIYDRLKERFGDKAIFMDVDNIPIGYDFTSYINFVLRQCRVVLIVMGMNWSSVLAHDGPHSGQPRLNDPADHVRIETEQALAQAAVNEAGEPIGDLRLIPLLVQGANMPRHDQLPDSLQRLTQFNGASLQRYPHFDHDMQHLLATIAHWIGDAATPIIPPQPQPQAATPEQEMVARLLPQIRSAFNGQDWLQVVRRVDYLRREFAERNFSAEDIPTEIYQMQGRALLGERDYVGAKAAWDVVCDRDPLDVAALQAAAEARIALGREGKPSELAVALSLLSNAITFSNDRSQRLALLHSYVNVLNDLARNKKRSAAQSLWNDLLLRANEGLRLAGELGSEQDAGWLTIKLEALRRLGQDNESLEVVRVLTALPGVTAALWLMRARLAWKLAGRTPTDEVRQSIDAADLLTPNDATVTQARQKFLVILKSDRFPPRLGQLGFTAQVRNGVKFIVPPTCLVSADEFLMGSDTRHTNNPPPYEQPQHRVSLATYAIARFPVTVAEYACFVETGEVLPDDWPYDWEDGLSQLDHPVVNVSWDDAVAYAEWLAELTGQPWRLPSEAEWEKAGRWDAQAGVARLYPWGDRFDASCCNTYECGSSGTTPVGEYPNGVSPYGANDMSGNVWEWTHSLHKPYPYIMSDGREKEDSTDNRVLRGGSWGSDAWHARAAYRDVNRPDYLNAYVGFRLALTISQR